MRTVMTAVCLFVLACASPSRAQSTFGTLVGTVTDDIGAVRPGVTVLVSNVNTGVQRTIVSDGTGTYEAANLDAGRYVVTLTLTSFADRTLDVGLLARQTVRADARLRLAGSQERVDVAAASPVSQSESMLAYAAGKLVNGVASDLIGGRRMFLAWMIGLIAATLAFGVSAGFAAFVAAWTDQSLCAIDGMGCARQDRRVGTPQSGMAR